MLLKAQRQTFSCLEKQLRKQIDKQKRRLILCPELAQSLIYLAWFSLLYLLFIVVYSVFYYSFVAKAQTQFISHLLWWLKLSGVWFFFTPLALMILTALSSRYKHSLIAISIGFPMVILAVSLQISFDLTYILNHDVIAYIVLFTPKHVAIFIAVYLYWFFMVQMPSSKRSTITPVNHSTTKNIDVEHLGRPLQLATCDITVINASGNYVEIETNHGNYLKRDTLKQLLKLLPSYFFQCHRSHIINLKKVKSLTNQASGNGYVLLTNNQKIAVSKRYKSLLKQQLKHQINFDKNLKETKRESNK